MNDHPLDDVLLVALREARPAGSDDRFVPEGPEAARLLAEILRGEERRRGADGPVSIPLLAPGAGRKAEAVHDDLAPTPGFPSLRSKLGSRRGRWVTAVAAALLIAGIVAPLATSGRPSESPSAVPFPGAGVPAPWKLAGYISQPAWAVQSAGGSDPYDLTCPGSTICYTTGPSAPTPSGPTTTPPQSVVELTHDGGATWQQSLVPSAGVALSSVTCPAIDTCMVAGNPLESSTGDEAMFTTVDGGGTWASSSIPGRSDSTPLLSCSTPQMCVVLASEPGPGGLGIQYVSYVTTDGGVDWASSNLPGTFRAYRLVCSASGRCLATGQRPSSYAITNVSEDRGSGAVIYSTDGGATWTPGSVPPGGVIAAVSCADTTHCMALENNIGTDQATSQVLMTDDGGEDWSALPSNDLAQLNLGAISCPTVTNCWVSGATGPRGANQTDDHGVILGTEDGGQTWTSEPVPTVQNATLRYVGAMACPAVATCLALANSPTPSSILGQQVVLSSYGGSIGAGSSGSTAATS